MKCASFFVCLLWGCLYSAQPLNAQTQGHLVAELWSTLLQASGNTDDFPPTLETVESDAMGPAYYSGGTIHLHQGLLDSLQNTLSDADAARGVAYVLAHELAHHNRRHIATHFAKKSLRRTEVGTAMRQNKALFTLSHETDADQMAGLYTHIAGIPALDLAPEVLQAIYTAYAIPDSLPGYPSLNERQRIATKMAEEMENVALLYDLALFATALGLHEEAEKLVVSLIRDLSFNPTEVYDMLALIHFDWAITLLQDVRLSSWQFPIQMVSRPFSKELTRGLSSEDVVTALYHLDKAIKWGSKGNVGSSPGKKSSGIVFSAQWLKLFVEEAHSERGHLIASCVDEESKVLFETLERFLQGKSKKALKQLNAVEFVQFKYEARVNAALVQFELGEQQNRNEETQANWTEMKRTALMTSRDKMGFDKIRLGSGLNVRIHNEAAPVVVELPGETERVLAYWDGNTSPEMPLGINMGETQLDEVAEHFGAQCSILQLSSAVLLGLKNDGLLLYFGIDETLRGVVWLVK